MFRFLGLFEEVTTFLAMVIKFPMRWICKKKDHDWYFYGGGWIFSAKYSFVCKRCGCRSIGTFDDLEKKGFKGTAKLP